MKRPPLKLIQWADAFNGDHAWTEEEDIPEEIDPLIISTTGFEIRRSEELVTLAMSWHPRTDGEGAHVCDLFHIPISQIRRERTIR